MKKMTSRAPDILRSLVSKLRADPIAAGFGFVIFGLATWPVLEHAAINDSGTGDDVSGWLAKALVIEVLLLLSERYQKIISALLHFFVCFASCIIACTRMDPERGMVLRVAVTLCGICSTAIGMRRLYHAVCHAWENAPSPQPHGASSAVASRKGRCTPTPKRGTKKRL